MPIVADKAKPKLKINKQLPQTYTKPYQNKIDFHHDLKMTFIAPIFHLYTSAKFFLDSIWSTLKLIGNLLILKPKETYNELGALSTYLRLTMASLFLAPICMMSYAAALLIRAGSSWIHRTPETVSNKTVVELLKEQAKSNEKYIPLNKEKFFKPYTDASDVIKMFVSIGGHALGTGASSLEEAWKTIRSAFEAIVYLAIAKPHHSWESIKTCSAHFVLSLSLALLVPINALIEAVAWCTRFGATWKETFNSLEPIVPSATAIQ